MPLYNVHTLNTQNDLLLNNLITFYNNPIHLQYLMDVIDGTKNISLRIVDWFVTNYAKKYYTIYDVDGNRFKVYNDYKLKLKAYSKKRFDPFCRWERIQLGTLETTIGQLNFFKWAIENHILEYIEDHYDAIESDMNTRNTSSKRRNGTANSVDSVESQESTTSSAEESSNNKTRKKREELSVLACKGFRRETVKIMVKFS
jgi:hypothetical protein